MNASETVVLKAQSIKTITVRRKPGRNPAAGLLTFGGQTVECRLGRSGLRARKREGDGATPIGRFRLLFGYSRMERVKRIRTQLQLKCTKNDDGWCDDSESSSYNKPVKLPFSSSHEEMCRDDRLYDICLVMNYNIFPVQRGTGSAIFFHLTSESRKPTEGCIAIDPQAMKKLLPFLSSQTEVEICP
ncbi:MAG: L,D-transpeptidase family protein [Rhizobiaceae bacterium]